MQIQRIQTYKNNRQILFQAKIKVNANATPLKKISIDDLTLSGEDFTEELIDLLKRKSKFAPTCIQNLKKMHLEASPNKSMHKKNWIKIKKMNIISDGRLIIMTDTQDGMKVSMMETLIPQQANKSWQQYKKALKNFLKTLPAFYS